MCCCSAARRCTPRTYYRGPPSPLGSQLNCTNFTIEDAASSVYLRFEAPNIVTLLQLESTGVSQPQQSADAPAASATGNFTLVYNQGVEFWLASEVWFAFSAGNYTHPQDECGRTRPGWVHALPSEDRQQTQDWACFIALKQQNDTAPQRRRIAVREKIILSDGSTQSSATESLALSADDDSDPDDSPDALFRTDYDLISRINAAQGAWVAAVYPEHERMTNAQMQRRRGTPRTNGLRGWEQLMPQPPRRAVSAADRVAATAVLRSRAPPRALSDPLPSSWDWRNVSGVNFVSPVRDQSGCGSCYAFSVLGMLESRIRIATSNALQPILSVQSLLSCSEYSQGCEGGFPFLAAKFATDFGLVDESCMPYVGDDTPCELEPTPLCKAERWKADEYHYVGGYFGMSSARGMQEEILANGPVSVCFEV